MGGQPGLSAGCAGMLCMLIGPCVLVWASHVLCTLEFSKQQSFWEAEDLSKAQDSPYVSVSALNGFSF